MHVVLLSSQTLYVLPFRDMESVQLFLDSEWFRSGSKLDKPSVLFTSQTEIATHKIDVNKSFSNHQLRVVCGWRKWLRSAIHYELSTSQIEYWTVALNLVESGSHRLRFSGDANLPEATHQEKTQKWLAVESKYIASETALRKAKLALVEDALIQAGVHNAGPEYTGSTTLQSYYASLRSYYTRRRTAAARICYARIDYVPVQYRGGHT